MKLGEILYIALYSKGHSTSVIEIRQWLNPENIISRLALHYSKKLIRNHWIGTLSLYIVIPYQLHVEWRSLEISSISHPSMDYI